MCENLQAEGQSLEMTSCAFDVRRRDTNGFNPSFKFFQGHADFCPLECSTHRDDGDTTTEVHEEQYSFALRSFGVISCIAKGIFALQRSFT